MDSTKGSSSVYSNQQPSNTASNVGSVAGGVVQCGVIQVPAPPITIYRLPTNRHLLPIQHKTMPSPASFPPALLPRNTNNNAVMTPALLPRNSNNAVMTPALLPRNSNNAVMTQALIPRNMNNTAVSYPVTHVGSNHHRTNHSWPVPTSNALLLPPSASSIISSPAIMPYSPSAIINDARTHLTMMDQTDKKTPVAKMEDINGVSGGNGVIGGEGDGEDGDDGDGEKMEVNRWEKKRVVYEIVKELRHCVARRWLVTAGEEATMKPEEKEQREWVSVRLVRLAGSGSGAAIKAEDLYIVAGDLFLLLHIRGGNVAKCVKKTLAEKHRPKGLVPPPTKATPFQTFKSSNSSKTSSHTAIVLSIYGMLDTLRYRKSERRDEIRSWIVRELALLLHCSPQDIEAIGPSLSLNSTIINITLPPTKKKTATDKTLKPIIQPLNPSPLDMLATVSTNSSLTNSLTNSLLSSSNTLNPLTCPSSMMITDTPSSSSSYSSSFSSASSSCTSAALTLSKSAFTSSTLCIASSSTACYQTGFGDLPLPSASVMIES